MSAGNHNRSKLLSTFGGLHERIYCDHDHPADMLIKTAQDCAPVIAENKMLAEDGGGQTADKSMTLVARFPMIFADKAMREGWFNDENKWRDMCNDPDMAAFRVWRGRV